MLEACKLCRGACCEAIQIPDTGNRDLDRWVGLHQPKSIARVLNAMILPTRCRALVDGKCSIYDSRPHVCVVYEPGGNSCRDTVNRGRSPSKAARILALLDELPSVR